MELVYGANGRPRKIKSLPLGCVRVRDTLLHGRQPAGPALIDAAVGELVEKMRRGFREFIGLPAVVLGSGGTCTTLTSLHCSGQPRVRIHELEGLAISAGELQALLAVLAASSLASLRAHPRIPYHRADVITAGACVLYAALRTLGAGSVHCTTRGLRYGVWQKLVAPEPFKLVRHEDEHED